MTPWMRVTMPELGFGSTKVSRGLVESSIVLLAFAIVSDPVPVLVDQRMGYSCFELGACLHIY